MTPIRSRGLLVDFKYGYCCYSFEYGYDIFHDVNYIDFTTYALLFNLYVYSEHRRKGRARGILECMVKTIRDTGYEGEIIIEAMPDEDSISRDDLISFYRRMGLTVLSPDRNTADKEVVAS